MPPAAPVGCGRRHFRILQNEIPGTRGPCLRQANRNISTLALPRRFETMPAAATSKTRYSRGHEKVEKFPCRWSGRSSHTHRRGAAPSRWRVRGGSRAVAVGCVNANSPARLARRDRDPTYIDRIKAGHIVPGAKWTIVKESPTTTVIDGHWGFGSTSTPRRGADDRKGEDRQCGGLHRVPPEAMSGGSPPIP